MKSRLLIVLFAIVTAYVYCNREGWKENMYYSDIDGYYMYLPAIFVYHDLAHMGFNHQVHMDYGVTEDTYYVFDQPTGRRTDMYAIGTAVMELPLFLIAYAWTDNINGHPPDGYSMPYQLAGFFSTWLWVIIGLIALRKLLLHYHKDTVVALTLAAITFGTNLYTYTAFVPGMSHPFVFTLFCLSLYYTQRWYGTHRRSSLLMLALCLGMAVVTRPIAVIIVLPVAFWECGTWQAVQQRFLFFGRNLVPIAYAALVFAAICLIQMSYWKFTSGHWVFFSYQNDGFIFSQPRIADGLWSYRKGWFLYTPIALAGMAGLLVMWWRNRAQAPVMLVYFVITIYVVFSWRNWWYGGGFSCRAMIDSLAVMALPLAVFVDWVLVKKSVAARAAFLVFIAACILLNCFQSYQYIKNILHCDRMSRAAYWKIFGRWDIDTAEINPYLMSEHDYNEEVRKRFAR